MNKLKKLQEKRAAIITEMEEANESRVFDIFESKELELKELDKEINAEKRMLELKKNKNVNIDKIFRKRASSKENHSGIGLWEVQKYVSKTQNLNLVTTKNNRFFTQKLEIYDEVENLF